MSPERLFFHTIAAEPARWSQKRVSRPLLDLIPEIAGASFFRLEIFEPHLRDTASNPAIRTALKRHHLEPVILSSYLNLLPAGAAEIEIGREIAALERTLDFFTFQKVRIFPGSGIHPSDTGSVQIFAKRLARLAKTLAGIEILLETHDGSIADDPSCVVELVKAVDMPNIGLLFQPTVFEQERAMRQLEAQRPFIRHVHLQNRNQDMSFATLNAGVIKWDRILSELPEHIGLTLEFTPLGVCPEIAFDLPAVMNEAASERSFIERITSSRQGQSKKDTG